MVSGLISRSFHSVHGVLKARILKWFAFPSPVNQVLPEYTEVYKKGLNYLDNYDGVITHLEPDILECEVKGALGSITTNKASGGDGIPAELFQILKDDAVKVLHSICEQIWKTQEWTQDWKSCFHSNSKEGQCQRMFKLPHNCPHFTCYPGKAQNSSS